MTTYEERRDTLAVNSSILVQVMLGGARGDAEFSLVYPRPANAVAMEEELRARWPGRGLRAVGFIGLVNMQPQLVLKEPLGDVQVQALAVAAGVYFGTLIKAAMTSGSFTAEIERAEVSELERLYAMPDFRYIN
jgi:hypothetical protein